MKAKVYYIATLLICMLACTDDQIVIPPENGQDHIVSFRVSIPEEKVIQTKGEAIQPGIINNMYVLVFDHNGFFLSRNQAIAGADPGTYSFRLAPTDQELEESNKKRIVHFICNYDWTGYSDVRNLGKHENEIVGSLSVKNGTVAYWQRIELGNGVVQESFPASIELLRNTAKVSILGSTDKLENIYFALGDYYDYGTVAPFNTTTYSFDENSVVESPFATLQSIAEGDFVSVDEGRSIQCYEKMNSKSFDPLYIIIKAKYGPEEIESYYKIDIFKEDGVNGEGYFYDIQRNYHYIVDIIDVKAQGSSSLQEAINSPASNNLLYSVMLEEYPSISDGTSALYVETTIKTLVNGNQEFSIPFSYIPNIENGIEDNEAVQFTIEQDPNKPVINTSTQNIITASGEAAFTAQTISEVPEYDVHIARLVLKTYKDGTLRLRRSVLLRFRKASEFGNPHIEPQIVPNKIGTEIALKFDIPNNIRQTLFPMEIFITTKTLSPSMIVNDNLSLDYQIPGQYRYRYVAQEAGEQTIHFATTVSTITENILLEAEVFAPKIIELSY